MMDHISSAISSNPHPSSSIANTSSTTSSSVIVQQSSGNHPIAHLSGISNSGEFEGLTSALSSTTTSTTGHNTSTATTTAGQGAAQELTPVQQQRTISTTQQHLSTPTGPGSTQSPVLSPPGKVFGRNYNGTSE